MTGGEVTAILLAAAGAVVVLLAAGQAGPRPRDLLLGNLLLVLQCSGGAVYQVSELRIFNFCNIRILQFFFGGLVLGCTETNFCNRICV